MRRVYLPHDADAPLPELLLGCLATTQAVGELADVEACDSLRQSDETHSVGISHALGEPLCHRQESLGSVLTGAPPKGNERRLGGQGPRHAIRLTGAEGEQQVEGLEVRRTNRIDPREAHGDSPNGIDAAGQPRIQSLGPRRD